MTESSWELLPTLHELVLERAASNFEHMWPMLFRIGTAHERLAALPRVRGLPTPAAARSRGDAPRRAYSAWPRGDGLEHLAATFHGVPADRLRPFDATMYVRALREPN